MLAGRKMNLEDVARNLEIISFTVKEYLNIYKIKSSKEVMIMQNNFYLHITYAMNIWRKYALITFRDFKWLFAVLYG